MLQPVEQNDNIEEKETSNSLLPDSPPKILNMRIFTIGDKPVFLGNHGDSELWNLKDREYQPSPTYLDYFSERDVELGDLGGMIVDGLLDHDDFQKLDKAELLTDDQRNLYTKMRELNDKLNHLESSLQKDAPAIVDSPPDDGGVVGPEEGAKNALKELIDLVRGNSGEAIGESVLDAIIRIVNGDDLDTERIKNAIANGASLDEAIQQGESNISLADGGEQEPSKPSEPSDDTYSKEASKEKS